MTEPKIVLTESSNHDGQLKTVHNTLDVLEYLSENKSPVRLTQICKHFGFPKSKVHRILATLEERSYVQQDENRMYVMGVGSWFLARSVSSVDKLIEILKSNLDYLSAEVKETLFISTLMRRSITYIHTRMSSSPTLAYISVGTQLPIHATSSGKILLSHQEPEFLNELINDGLQRFTENTITDGDELVRQIEQAKQNGYSIEREEQNYGLSAVATSIPAFAPLNHVALGFLMPSSRADMMYLKKLAGILLHEKEKIFENYKALSQL